MQLNSWESVHSIRLERRATVAVSTRKRCGPRPTDITPASIRESDSFSVKSESMRKGIISIACVVTIMDNENDGT